MTGQEQPEIKTEKEILESYDFDSDIIDQLDNFGNKLWVSAQSEIKFLEEQLRRLDRINVHYIQNKCYDLLDDTIQDLTKRIKQLKGEK